MSNKIFTALEMNEYLLAVNIDAISAYSIVLLRQLFKVLVGSKSFYDKTLERSRLPLPFA